MTISHQLSFLKSSPWYSSLACNGWVGALSVTYTSTGKCYPCRSTRLRRAEAMSQANPGCRRSQSPKTIDACYRVSRRFAIYLILLGWKTCKYYYETDQLPNSRKYRLKAAFGLLLPPAINFFVGWDRFYIGNRIPGTRNPPNQILRKHASLVLRGTIVIMTCIQHKNLYIPPFLLTIFGPDYYVP